MGTKFLTTGQIASYAGVERTTVHRWAAEGKLPVAQTLNGLRLFDPKVVEAFLKEREAKKNRKAAS